MLAQNSLSSLCDQRRLCRAFARALLDELRELAAGLEPSFLIHSQKECLDRISRRAVAFLWRGLLQVAYQVTSDWRLLVRDPLCMRVCLNNVLSCRIITLHLLQSKGQHYERIFKNGRSKWGFSHARSLYRSRIPSRRNYAPLPSNEISSTGAIRAPMLIRIRACKKAASEDAAF